MSENLKPAIRFKEFTDDWEKRKLGEIADFSKGHGYTKSDLREFGTPIILYGRLYTKYQTIIREVDTFADVINGAVLSKGSEVILPSSGETAEDIAIAASVEKSGFLLGGGLNVVIPHGELQPAFLALEISYGKPHNDLAKRAQGKSVVHLYNEDLKAVTVTYPLIDEQCKISAFFDHLDHLITLQQRKCESLSNVKKAMLEKMFPKNGSVAPEIRFAGFDDVWEKRKLGEFGSVSMCKRIFKDQTTDEGDVPFYKIGTFGIEADAFISRELFEDYKRKYSYPERGTILISASGSIGRTVEFTGKDEYFQDSNIVWLNHDKRLDDTFLKVLYEIVRWAGIEGSTIKRLYNDNFLKTKVLLPSIEEQKAIGSLFRTLDNLITLHQSKLEKLKNIKKTCLEKMFV